MIGDTTENPAFEVIAALLSRCQVYVLKPLAEGELQLLLQRVLQQDVLLKTKRIELQQTRVFFRLAQGDGWHLLNTFELVVGNLANDQPVTDEVMLQIVQQNPLRYDKAGDMRYDLASAFIKSIRGSDPNAAVYYLAHMIEAGEDPSFTISRRMVIAASEDIGNANPTALVVATNCFTAVNLIGYPEARIVLSQVAIYLATSPKSNSAYAAIKPAQ